MIKILLVDDVEDNLVALDLLLEEYMEDNKIENYQILSEIDSIKGLEVAKSENIDIIFLDIMMPKLDGFEFLKNIREDKNITKQPIVVMTTALGDKKTKDKEQSLGANAFMVKPISFKIVSIMLERYLTLVKDDDICDEDYFDDFGDFDDFDSLDDFEESIAAELSPTSIMLNGILNRTYEHVSAKEFLDEYENQKDVIYAAIEDIDDMVFKILDTDDNLLEENQIEIFITIFGEFKKLLSTFSELLDLYVVIETIEKQIKDSDISNLDEKQLEKIYIFTKAIIDDLIEFKEQVFVSSETKNIFYLNASIASSSMQIDTILNK